MTCFRQNKLTRRAPPDFQTHLRPPESQLAGWSALVHELDVEAPVRRPSCVSLHHVRGSIKDESSWRIFDKRYAPDQSIAGHLTFALRHEDLDLLVLKLIFEKLAPSVIENIVKESPTGATSRRLWFFYEMLTERNLGIPDIRGVTAVDAIDPQRYFTGKAALSKRHRVRDNLLGARRHVPLIRRTKTLERFIAANLAQKANETIGRIGAHMITRAASFLLLADSRASFEIEGERPPRNRLERGAARSCRPADVLSRSTKSFACTGSSSRTRVSSSRVCVPIAFFWASATMSEIRCPSSSALGRKTSNSS